MVSPRCGCGYETRAGFRTFKKPARPEEALQVHADDQAADVDTANWRSQLDRKFESTARQKVSDLTEFQRRVEDTIGEDSNPSAVSANPRKQGGAQAAPAVAEVFHPTKQSPAAVNFGTEVHQVDPIPEEPEPVMTSRRPPEQQTLTLEPLVTDFPRVTPADASSAKFKPVSKEIIFTRILAGILDLVFPVLLAMVVVFGASKVLEFSFFSTEATTAWLVMAGTLFIVNELFFFWTTGQTPGMVFTSLELVDEKGDEPDLKPIATRTALFLVVGVLGMPLALFDSECRALHDRLSGTKVIHCERAG